MVGSSRDGLPTGTVTFLFSDIEGSTRLAQDLGHEGWARPPDASTTDSSIGAVADADGVVVKHEGDGAFAVFSDRRRCRHSRSRRSAAELAEPGPLER